MSEQQPSQTSVSLFTQNRRLLLGCLGVLLLMATFLTGLGIGYGLGRWRPGHAFPVHIGPPTFTTDNRCSDNTPANVSAALCPQFATFWEAMNLLYSSYDGPLPKAEDVTYAAIRGVVALLHDPNTTYITPAEADLLRADSSQSLFGIGARISWDEKAGAALITEVFENQPAFNAGLRRNDLILAVDGESLAGADLASIGAKIRGPQGSVVTLLVRHAQATAPVDISVKRDRVEVPTVTTTFLGNPADIAYVHLTSFNENAGQQVRQAVSAALHSDPRGVILDLRDNSGGLVREAIDIAGIFLEDQPVLSERFKDGSSETYRSTGRALSADVPLVVLVNGGSASASEIVAGALQDSGRAKLIGTRTFGKGTVQLPQRLTDGSILRLTVGHWSTPGGRAIDHVGLEPDITAPSARAPTMIGADPQIDAAIKFLHAVARR